MKPQITDFLQQSNWIEGIRRGPTWPEYDAFVKFYESSPTVDRMNQLQLVFAPGMPLRTKRGMDVQVGNYVAPRGGDKIAPRLAEILNDVRLRLYNPWKSHCEYETLHPYMDGNGRTGRMLWAWHMSACGYDPFSLPFLHRFYYQTLENSDGRP